jgi:hypothetical protein
MATLHDTLWNLTVDDLRYRLKFLDPGSKATRKSDFIDGIKTELTGPGLVATWNDLDETGRLAVIEAVHDADHRHHPVRFRSKYGRDAEFHIMPENARSYYSWQTPKNATRLNLFFYPESHGGSLVIPPDLAELLRPMVPEPSPTRVPCIPEPVAECGLRVRHTESEALAELGALLRLAAAEGLSFGEKTGIPAKNSLAGIEASLVGGDWFPPELAYLRDRKSWQQEIGPIKPVGWTRMLHAAGLIAKSGSKSVLTQQGRRAVEKPAWETIENIWRKWIANKEYDEFNRIDIIKGQTVKGALTAKTPRRSAILAALAKCPAGEWISYDGFSNYMRADGFMFDVSHDPWKLYIADRQYGALGYSGYGGWDVLQDRYLLCVLMEYAATLGPARWITGAWTNTHGFPATTGTRPSGSTVSVNTCWAEAGSPSSPRSPCRRCALRFWATAPSAWPPGASLLQSACSWKHGRSLRTTASSGLMNPGRLKRSRRARIRTGSRASSKNATTNRSRKR